MLLGAYSVLLKCPGRQLGGATVSPEPAQWGTSGAARGRFYGDRGQGFDRTAATPSGYAPGYGWIPAQKSGAIASTNQIAGSGAIDAANLAGGLNAEAALTGAGAIDAAAATALAHLGAALAGTGTLSADASAIAEATAAILGAGLLAADILATGDMAAALDGTGTISDAALALVVSLTADLAGTGTISDAAMGLLVNATADLAGTSALGADITGAYAIAADLAGAGSCAAAMGALAGLVAELSGTGSVSGSASALGHISADITLSSEAVTPASVAAAVWNAAVASFQDAGSMGEAMATAGSGGLSPTQATMLLELYRLAGLDPTRPLVVTTTTRDAGDISQTITEAAGTVTVERQ